MVMMLSVRDLAFSYGSGARSLEGISLAVDKGDVLCILGPNGSGKTTLLRCLIGSLVASRGQIELGGVDARSQSPKRLAQQLAYVPQSTQSVFGHLVLDIVMMGRTSHLKRFETPGRQDVEIAKAALTSVGIAHLAGRQFTTISGGEKQLCLLARAVVQQPKVLILDEPAASLDFGNQIQILDILGRLAASGLAIVMTTHHPDHALQIGSSILALREGRVVADGPTKELLDEGFLSSLYGTPIRVIRSFDGLAACLPCPATSP